jgi:preprotein translocase subunit SecA
VDVKGAGIDFAQLNHEELKKLFCEKVQERYEEKEKQLGAEMLRWLERRIILDIVDTQWKDHLLSLDHLKEGIGLRGYGQKDPLVEFKKEAFNLFEEMMARIDNETVRFLFLVQVQRGEGPEAGRGAHAEPQQPRTPPTPVLDALESKRRRAERDLQMISGGMQQAEAPRPIRAGAKVGRNEPCPCGSGKKYKKCHGMSA